MSNNFSEEKMQILKMVENGKITSEEGIELLNALEEKKPETNIKSTKSLKVRIYDSEDKTKVNVNIPLSLVDIGIKLASAYSPELKDSGIEKFDLKQIVEEIKNGAEGKIVDIENDDGEKIEVIVE